MRWPQWLPSRPDLPGLALATGIGAIAVIAVRLLPSSPLLSDVLIALFVGMFVRNTPLTTLVGLGPVGKEREPDRYAAGLRWTGKWVLRLSIVLMGLKVQASFFGRTEVVTIVVVAAASVPSAFLIAHVLGAWLRVRRPLVDLLAGGTMICGASAVNAIAPACRAHRDEQGIAIAVVFLFSVVAMLTFRTIAFGLGLDASFAGLWSGLAVNDLASAIAVGAQMGESGGVMAAASKSFRILMLAPVLVSIALLRRDGRPKPIGKSSLTRTIVDALPGFILGYIVLAIVRIAGDQLIAGASWKALLGTNKLIVDILMSAVAAGIGLHLSLRSVLGSSARAVAVGAGAAAWMAGLTVLMITLVARGQLAAAIGIGVAGVVVSFVLYRVFAGEKARVRAIEGRFDAGGLVTLEEATVLLEGRERRGALEDGFLRLLLDRLSPSIGELIPARTSRLDHGDGCRWLTYWEGRSGWALVAVVRDPGSTTPIHAHPHRMLGKAIEGQLEELRFRASPSADQDPRKVDLELTWRGVLAHEELVEADGPSALHVVRAVSKNPAIDIQLRGPELGMPGRLLRPCQKVDVVGLSVGARLTAFEEIDARPGQSGDGASAGRPAPDAM